MQLICCVKQVYVVLSFITNAACQLMHFPNLAHILFSWTGDTWVEIIIFIIAIITIIIIKNTY